MTYYVKAMLRGLPCLPLRFSAHIIVEPRSWTGHRYSIVYVPLYFYRELKKTPDYRDGCKTAWEYYFVGRGLAELSLESALSFLAEEVRGFDYTFSGDDETQPVPNLSFLDKELEVKNECPMQTSLVKVYRSSTSLMLLGS